MENFKILDYSGWKRVFEQSEATAGSNPVTDELIKSAPIVKGDPSKKKVGLLQELLRKAGLLKGTGGPLKNGVDGDFGGGTETALTNFIGKPTIDKGDGELLNTKIAEKGIDQNEVLKNWETFGNAIGLVMTDQGVLQDAYDKYYSKKGGFPTPSGNLRDDVVSYIYFKEGGITDDPDDSGPASDPMPFTYDTSTKKLTDSKGKAVTLSGLVPKKTKSILNNTYSSKKWHTNKGITWNAWKSRASGSDLEKAKSWLTLGKEDVSKKYFDRYFTPAMSEIGGATNSELANHFIGMVRWGTGNASGYIKNYLNPALKQAGITKTGKDGINEALAKLGEKKTLDIMTKARLDNFESIGKANPSKQKYVKGWSNSKLNFHNTFVNNYANKETGIT